MIKKALSHNPSEQSRLLSPRATSPHFKLVTAVSRSGKGKYQVRVGHQLFQGDDTRHLLKLAVQARRAQNRPLSGRSHPCC